MGGTVRDAEFPELYAVDFTGGTVVTYGLKLYSGALFENRRAQIEKVVKTDGIIEVGYNGECLQITRSFTFLEGDGIFWLVKERTDERQPYGFLEYAIAPRGIEIPPIKDVHFPSKYALCL